MDPIIQYALVAVGLGIGYKTGGYLGYILTASCLAVGLRLFLQGGQCRSTTRLDGKTVVITGANTGIGKITAADMARRGARVIMLCRDLSRAEPAAADIRSETNGDVLVEKMDLASLTSISDCVERLKKKVTKIDILINNAGVMLCPLARTEQGFEMQIGTNHFGHFYLTNLLLPLIKEAAPGARIVTVSSGAHQTGKMHWEDINWEKAEYEPWAAYAQSKLANILFTQELAERLKGSGVTAYSLHPGVIATELWRHVGDHGNILSSLMALLWRGVSLFVKTPESGAQTTIFCAVDESVANDSGLYYADCGQATPAKHARVEGEPKRLWEISEKLTGLSKS